MDALKIVESYWDAKASGEVSDCARIESGRRAQKMRFENFVLNQDLEGATILDVGCGVGDFYEHLESRGISCDYLGVDLSAEMIARCQARFPKGKFECANILDWPAQPRFDYVVAFAIHNVVIPQGKEILEKVTAQQFHLCHRAAHTSLLTSHFKGFDPHIQPWNPAVLLEFGLTLSPFVSLRHDYLPNDFSLTISRRPLIDTRAGLLLD